MLTADIFNNAIMILRSAAEYLIHGGLSSSNGYATVVFTLAETTMIVDGSIAF